MNQAFYGNLKSVRLDRRVWNWTVGLRRKVFFSIGHTNESNLSRETSKNVSRKVHFNAQQNHSGL